jgi:hypothetical protein
MRREDTIAYKSLQRKVKFCKLVLIDRKDPGFGSAAGAIYDPVTKRAIQFEYRYEDGTLSESSANCTDVESFESLKEFWEAHLVEGVTELLCREEVSLEAAAHMVVETIEKASAEHVFLMVMGFFSCISPYMSGRRR